MLRTCLPVCLTSCPLAMYGLDATRGFFIEGKLYLVGRSPCAQIRKFSGAHFLAQLPFVRMVTRLNSLARAGIIRNQALPLLRKCKSTEIDDCVSRRKSMRTMIPVAGAVSGGTTRVRGAWGRLIAVLQINIVVPRRGISIALQLLALMRQVQTFTYLRGDAA